MSKRGLLLFALSVIAGVAVGGIWRQKSPQPALEGTSSTTREASAPARKWRLEDFIAAVRAPKTPGGLPATDRFNAEISQWSNDELRAALDECMHSPEGSLVMVQASIRYVLLKEWVSRDPDAALAWFDALDPPVLRRRVGDELSYHWPEAKAEEGFAYFIAHRDLFDPQSTTFQNLLIDFRSKQGADAVYAALKEIHAAGLSSFGAGLKLGDGFDFPRLLSRDLDALVSEEERAKSKFPSENRLFEQRLIEAWYAQDRDRAFDWLLEERGVAGLAAICSSRNQNYLQWLPGKLAALPPQQQDEFLTATRMRWLFDMSSLEVFAMNAKDPALQEKAQVLAVQEITSDRMEGVLGVLGANPDPARRIALLEETPLEPSQLRRVPSAGDFSVDMLRQTLVSWGAEPARIDAIVARYFQPEAGKP